MALTFRDTKGSPLTSAEADANIRTLAAAAIDFANPVLVTAAATLQANKAHQVSGTGYALALPDPAANAGMPVFINIAANATGLYPMAGTAYSLYAGESLLLRAIAGTWKKTGGELLPLIGRLETTLAQQTSLPSATLIQIPFSVAVEEVAALPAFTAQRDRFVVQRAGRATVSATAALADTQAGGAYFYLLSNSRGGTLYQTLLPASNALAQGGFTTTINVLAGDILTVAAYNNDGQPTARLRGQFAGSQCVFTFTEIV